MKKQVYLIILIIVSILSCNTTGKKECEGFDVEILKLNKVYFHNDLYYSNGTDTILLKLTTVDTSSTYNFRSNGFSFDECNPTFDLEYVNSDGLFEISMSYFYFPNKKNDLKLSLIVNSYSIELDNISKSKQLINVSEQNNLRKDLKPEDKIDKIILENHRITLIKKCNGETWKLIENRFGLNR